MSSERDVPIAAPHQSSFQRLVLRRATRSSDDQVGLEAAKSRFVLAALQLDSVSLLLRLFSSSSRSVKRSIIPLSLYLEGFSDALDSGILSRPDPPSSGIYNKSSGRGRIRLDHKGEEIKIARPTGEGSFFSFFFSQGASVVEGGSRVRFE